MIGCKLTGQIKSLLMSKEWTERGGEDFKHWLCRKLEEAASIYVASIQRMSWCLDVHLKRILWDTVNSFFSISELNICRVHSSNLNWNVCVCVHDSVCAESQRSIWCNNWKIGLSGADVHSSFGNGPVKWPGQGQLVFMWPEITWHLCLCHPNLIL